MTREVCEVSLGHMMQLSVRILGYVLIVVSLQNLLDPLQVGNATTHLLCFVRPGGGLEPTCYHTF